jgi:hypothetical protein
MCTLADPPPEFEHVPDRIVGALERGPAGFGGARAQGLARFYWDLDSALEALRLRTA